MIVGCLGYGYIASYLFKELSANGVRCYGVTDNQLSLDKETLENILLLPRKMTLEVINNSTHLVITAPPEKATFSASLRLVLAALVVLLLDAVADHIPINPASPEHIAPNINDKAIIPCSFELYPMNSRIATAKTKTAKTLYSLLRKAIAPLLI